MSNKELMEHWASSKDGHTIENTIKHLQELIDNKRPTPTWVLQELMLQFARGYQLGIKQSPAAGPGQV